MTCASPAIAGARHTRTAGRWAARRSWGLATDHVVDGRDRCVVDVVVTFIQAAAQDPRCNLGGLEELGGEAPLEDIGGRFLHPRDVESGLDGERVELGDQRTGQHRSRETTQGGLRDPSQRPVRLGLSVRVVNAHVGYSSDPRQVGDADLMFQVGQQQRAPVAKGPVVSGQELMPQTLRQTTQRAQPTFNP